MGLFDRLKQGLEKTRQAFADRMETVLRRRKIDEDLFEELEETLLAADIGINTVEYLLSELRREAKKRKLETADELLPVLQAAIASILTQSAEPMRIASEAPTVILVVGVNGVGKTTIIGKLAHRFRLEGKKVLMAAADTFRAAAIEQLSVWAERSQADIVKQSTGSDAAAVVYDALKAARARKTDVVLCDTAGRLQNKAHLMEELEKIHRVIAREIPGAPHETLLVLDATTGQNAIVQAKLFREAAHVSGIALTKLDGTAKGGIVIAINHELGLPVKWVGVGETIDDLQPFDADAFAQALFEKRA